MHPDDDDAPGLESPCALTIDLAALAANWRDLAARVAPAACGAVVKADAYGLGARAVVPALLAAGCRGFFVATGGEALALRPLLPPEVALYALEGPGPAGEAALAAAGVRPVLNSPEDLAAWRRLQGRAGRPLPWALHVDTGLNRLGLTRDELARAVAAGLPPGLCLVMSHLACADDPHAPMNGAQLARFEAARASLPPVPASLAASDGIFLGAAYHFDLVRPGAALYGLNPTPGRPNPMRPVIRLRARLLQVRQAAPGETVGYGATAHLPRGGRVGVLGIGYADGFRRALSGRGSVWLGSAPAPVLGRVSMDLVTVELSQVPPEACHVGAWADVIGGAAPDADDWGERAGTIGYEILTGFGPRVPRHYVGASATQAADDLSPCVAVP